MADGLEDLDTGYCRFIVECVFLEVCSKVISRIVELGYDSVGR